MRVKITLAYDGTDYFGSQTQKETDLTINGTLEKVFKALGIEQKIVASGRTDKGVHATAQVCHMDLPHYWSDLSKLKDVANSMLPPSISIKTIKPVADSFHARYDAKSRVYRYIAKAGANDPFCSRFVSFFPMINFEEIEQKIALFQGKHDFEFFHKSGSDTASTCRIIHKAFVYKYKSYIIFHFEANGFLRSQIRLMVAALMDLNATQIKQMLRKEKKYRLKPAPPNGLYLAKIKYEENAC